MDGKFLSDCELTSYMLDKHVILTRGGGEDYKISFNDLIDNIKYTLLRDYLKSKIGNIHINTNNKYRDNAKYNDGYIEYLMLNGQEINKKEYPELFKELEIEEEKYTLPNYWQEEGGCTLKHVKEGSGRALNSYEKDNIKEHVHTIDHEHKQVPHNHPDDHRHYMAHEHIVWQRQAYKGDGCGGADPAKGWGNGEVWSKNGREWTDGRNNGYTGGSLANIEKYQGSTGLTGQKENTVKNVAVQCYIAAKVLI